MLPGIQHLQTHDVSTVQNYMDAACCSLSRQESREHHVAVRLGSRLIQSRAHGPILQLTPSPPSGDSVPVASGNQDLIIGTHSEGAVTIFVLEAIADLRSRVLVSALLRMSGLIAMGLVAAVIMNIVLIQMVTRPLQTLVEKVRAVGRGEFPTGQPDFGNTEMNYLSAEINAMSETLAAVAHERTQRLRKARQIQEHLLPGDLTIPGITLGQLYLPAEQVGGDYFDILPLSDGQWLICLADATGHGVPAAMSAAMLKTCLLESTTRATSPAQILHEMNRTFMKVNLPGDFASLILVKLDLPGQQLIYANAGHAPTWFLDPGSSPQALSATGTLLGIIEDNRWPERTLKLPLHSRLALSTDGIPERFSPAGEMFGNDRLLRELVTFPDCPVNELTARIGQGALSHRGAQPQLDDMTLLVFDIRL